MEKKYFSKLGLMYFIGAIVIYAVQLIAIGIGNAVIPQYMSDGSIATAVYMIPTYLISYPIMIALISRVPVEQEVIEKKKMTVGQWIVAFIMSYALVYICNIIGSVITAIIGVFKQSAVENPILNVTMEMNTLTTFIIMVICAPIVEEIIFRKLLIDRASKYGEGLAILLSGTMFGLFHANLNQFVFTFVMGCFYGFIYTRTRNVIYSILLHMLNNFIASILSMFVLRKSGFLELSVAVQTASAEELTSLMMANISGILLYVGYVMLLLVVVITGVILLIVKRKKFYVNHTADELPKGQRFSAVILNVGMLLFCALMIFQIVQQLLA